MSHYDILVIGSGPAGHRAAIQAAKRGKKVAIIERKPRIGGAGLQTGTIPSKALREVAYAATFGVMHGMRGETVKPSVKDDFLAESVFKKNTVIDIQESVFLDQLKRNNVALIFGEAMFLDQNTLQVKSKLDENQTLTAEKMIVATGSRPRRPKDVPFDKHRVLDSTSILNMKTLPKKLTVVGGGVIACEFATIYAALGVDVCIVDSHPKILGFLCEDIAATLQQNMKRMGIAFKMNQNIQSITCDGERVTLTVEQESIESDALLYALGRVPNVNGLGFETLGIDSYPRGWVKTNENFQTNISNIYAVGDLIGSPSLAATGIEQGRIAALHACNANEAIISSCLPMAVYTIPEVAWVGKTSQELKEQNISFVEGVGRYKETARGQIIGDANGLLKLLVDPNTRVILGVHIVGESASELIHIGQMIMNLNGTVNHLIQNVFNYPTLAECYKIAALDCSSKIKLGLLSK
ncbi:MAG: NAD(P)(+) transhydrogenase [Zetaproteobacteria bacterium CG2_30_46_52]|nr:MAG: NAD(P)(+) transhydrogenase [Zetaproteobacteria bacterium CG2_30_46_52]